MRVVITNKLPYKREFQYYGVNQFVILGQCDKVIVYDIKNENEIIYYLSLNPQDFEVCFQDDNGKCICKEVKIKYSCLHKWVNYLRDSTKISNEIMQNIELENYLQYAEPLRSTTTL